ncbi:MAG: HD-GYP domain-containing protein [Bacillota bacterium]
MENKEEFTKYESRYFNLLMKIIDLNDPYKSGHSHKVASLAELISLEIGFVGEKLNHIKEASMFHDIGKVMLPGDLWVIPQEIEADEEREIIQKHPEVGARLLEESDFDQDVVRIVRYHHEWWDGTGYPEQLKGEEIPLMARIVAIAESYVSMITYNIYSEDMEKEDAINQIIKLRGSQFDPVVVDSFLEVI